MLDQNKQKNKGREIVNKQAHFDISEISILRDNPNLLFYYKKTEKLVSALYMLSSFISDKEPIKWQFRDEGVKLLSNSLSLSDRSNSELTIAYVGFVSDTLKIVSLLGVAYFGGIISEMNHNILKYEFQSLIKRVEEEGAGLSNKGAVFNDGFFDVLDKGHITVSDRISADDSRPLSSGSSIKRTEQLSPKKPSSAEISTSRQGIVIELLKKNETLGIKDFALAIKDCSEKTIQRELSAMVSKGHIKKTGEKRWSRYSLM